MRIVTLPTKTAFLEGVDKWIALWIMWTTYEKCVKMQNLRMWITGKKIHIKFAGF